MANQVTVTIVNQLSNALNLINYMPYGPDNTFPSKDYGDGKWDTEPVSSISANSTEDTAFSIEQKNLANGSQGYVQYDLGNKYGQLVLIFQCNGDKWDYFYALIQGYGSNKTPQQLSGPVGIVAEVSGYSNSAPCTFSGYSNMSITVTVSNNS